MKSPNNQKRYIQGAVDSSYLWAALLCVYTGVWRYLTGMYSGQPTFLSPVKNRHVMKKENVTKLLTALLTGIALIVVIYYILYLYCA